MEILPGVGLPVARVGWTCAQVQAAAGPPTSSRSGHAEWSEHSPPFAVYFDRGGRIQVVEVYAGANGHDQATLRGVQLTRRFMDDVVGDLAHAGLTGTRSDIVTEYDDGFTLWSLLSMAPDDVDDGSSDATADEVVVEGIGIAPAAYWAST